MTNEYYEIHYINFDKIIVSGKRDEQNIEVTLTDEQKDMLSAFLSVQADQEKEFIRGLIS